MTQPDETTINQVDQVPPAEPAPENAEDLSAAEAALTAIVITAFMMWMSRASEAVNGDTRLYGTAPDSDEIMFLAPLWTERVDKKIIPFLREVQHKGWLANAPVGRTYSTANTVMLDNLNRARNLLVNIPDEVYALVNAELRASAEAGDDVYHQANRVDQVLSVTGSQRWPNRAKVIAVTEVNRAYASSILASGFQSQLDEGRQLYKRWDSSNDSRVRPWHRKADGQVRPLGTAFDVGPDKLQYPGDPDGLPSNVIHCVLGDARVWATEIKSAFRSQWSGPVFSLHGEDGIVRTVTPNHPVLTKDGWIPACEVQEGDYLVSAVGDFVARFGPTQPHVQDTPPKIKEVFGTLSLAWAAQRVEDLSVDFHGDIPHGKVDVVLPDRELWPDLYFPCFDLPPELEFIYANGPAASLRPPFQTLNSVDNATDGLMGFGRLMDTLLRTHGLPPQNIGCRTAPYRNLQIPQTTLKRWSADVSSGRYAFEGLASKVAFTKIVKVDKDSFSGHVYSFETRSGIYIADNIVTHNCRCTLDIVDEEEING